MNKQELIQIVAKIEEECFFDNWDFDSLLSTLSYDYNDILVSVLVNDKEQLFFLSELNDKLIDTISDVQGYLLFNNIADESELLRVAVAADKRLKGIGRRLMDRYLYKLISDGAVKSLLEVRESNDSAIALYEKFDFKSIATRKNYYNNPRENAVIFERILLED